MNGVSSDVFPPVSPEGLVDELKRVLGRLYILAGIVVIGFVLFIWFAWPSTPDVVRLIEEAKKELTAQHEKVLKGKDEQLKTRDAEIKDRDARIVVEKGKYTAILKKYKELQDAKVSVQPAKTDQELRARFTAAGFDPIPADQSPPGTVCFSSR